MRTCRYCLEDKPIAAYALEQNGHRRTTCTPCRSQQQRINRGATPRPAKPAVQTPVARPEPFVRLSYAARAIQKAKSKTKEKGPRCARCSAFGSYQQILTKEQPGRADASGWFGRPMPPVRLFLCSKVCLPLFQKLGLVARLFPLSGQAAVELAA